MPSTQRNELLESIALTITDYRQGEITRPNAEHVDRWIRQFARFGADEPIQQTLLFEIDHILKHTYISKGIVTQFLRELIQNPRIAMRPDLHGDSLISFWRSVNFLRLQAPGSSQLALLEIVDRIMQEIFGFQTRDCGQVGGPYLFLDDCLFSGRRVRRDVIGWLRTNGELWGELYVVVLGRHRSGGWYTETEIEKVASDALTIVEWLPSYLNVEDRKAYVNLSEVLRPATVPDDPFVTEYARSLTVSGYPPILRKPGWQPRNRIFSSEIGRHPVEQFFLRAGAYLRAQAAYPDEDMRPLGYSALKTFGFGGLLVTHRNVANNCPLALWYGDPDAPSYHPFSKWYPLFLPKRR